MANKNRYIGFEHKQSTLCKFTVRCIKLFYKREFKKSKNIRPKVKTHVRIACQTCYVEHKWPTLDTEIILRETPKRNACAIFEKFLIYNFRVGLPVYLRKGEKLKKKIKCNVPKIVTKR